MAERSFLRTCFSCTHSSGGEFTWCDKYDEWIDSEIYAAAHCQEFARG